MKRLLAATLALILAFTLALPAFAANNRSPTYSDVTADAWYSDAVKYVTLGGLMGGAGGGKFNVNGTATRAEIAEALYRLVGSPRVQLTDSVYTDVSASAAHAAAILWAKENGIMGGVGGGRFDPNGTLNRETMATILYRVSNYAGKDTTKRASFAKYADADTISAWAKEEFAWAVAEGVFNGTSDTTLSPQQATPRSQIATLVQRTGEKVLDVTYPDDGTFVYALPEPVKPIEPVKPDPEPVKPSTKTSAEIQAELNAMGYKEAVDHPEMWETLIRTVANEEHARLKAYGESLGYSVSEITDYIYKPYYFEYGEPGVHWSPNDVIPQANYNIKFTKNRIVVEFMICSGSLWQKTPNNVAVKVTVYDGDIILSEEYVTDNWEIFYKRMQEH